MQRSFSFIWLVPLVTALLGGWLIVHNLIDRGPLVTITFRTAEGIEVDKTRLKYKNINIGIVERVSLSPDFSKVEVQARLSKEASHFLKRDSRFWVVRPAFSARGISGLGTLLSGAYIEIAPGDGPAQSLFVGLESPPLLQDDSQGKRITLVSRQLGSIERGSPILYQGIQAGEVTGFEMANDTRSVLIYAFVKAPYDSMVRSNTQFWSASGIDLRMDANGLRVKTESLQSLLFGGIVFDLPEREAPGSEDIAGLVFPLHENQQAVRERAFTRKLRYVLYFDDSVRGLTVGAPVEFKGIPVGTVTDVRLEYDEQRGGFRTPVLIDLEPERISRRGETMTAHPERTFQQLIQKGLRARLQSGNLLTGQLFIDLGMHPKSPLKLAGHAGGDITELPTVPGAGADRLLTSVGNIVNKLDRIDFERIGRELEKTLAGTSTLTNHPDLPQTLTDLGATLASLRKVLATLEDRTGPLTDNLDQALTKARETLAKTNQTLTLVDGLIAPDTPFHHHTLRLVQELSTTARSMRNLIDLLERNPQSLLLGKRDAETRHAP